MPHEATLEFIAILVTVAGLLGWLLKAVVNYFIKSAKEKDKYIESLVCKNQENVEKFTDTINHQRTQDREMQGKHLEAIRGLENEMNNANKVNKSILDFLKNK